MKRLSVLMIVSTLVVGTAGCRQCNWFGRPSGGGDARLLAALQCRRPRMWFRCGGTSHVTAVMRPRLQLLWQQHAAGAVRRTRLCCRTDELTKQPCLAGAMNLPARHGEGGCQPLSSSSTAGHVSTHVRRQLRWRAASAGILDLCRPRLVRLNLRDFRKAVAQAR